MDTTEADPRIRHPKTESYIAKFPGILNITFELKSLALSSTVQTTNREAYQPSPLNPFN